jgi:uncharacterized membrane protein YdjX (TVP38/TMEM64 family)
MGEETGALPDPAAAGTAPAERRRWKRWLVLGAVVLVAGGLYAASRVLPVAEHLWGVLEWVRGLGLLGYLVFGAVYVLACVLMVSGAVLTLGAGILFGLLWGTVAVSVSSTLGACVAFLVGRTVARGWIARKVEGSPRFGAIDRAVGREGFKIVLLTRLSPVFPFVLLNYAYALTDVAFWKYALASWIGMLPGTVMYVYFGTAVGSLAAAAAGEIETGVAGQVFFWTGLAVAVVVAVFVARVARRAIAESAPSCLEGEGPECAEADLERPSASEEER